MNHIHYLIYLKKLEVMAKKRRNKIVYIPNQTIHEKWWAFDAEGRKQLHLEKEYQKKLAKSRKN